jgi:D-aspartate ligase
MNRIAHQMESARQARAACAMPSAVVMCGGGRGAYDIVRSLGRAGIASAVFVSHSGDVALRSRYAQRSLLLPEFREWNFPDILGRVSAFGAACPDRPVLFYVGDSEIDFISRYRDVLSRWYRFVVPSDRILRAVMNKAQFIELAREADLPVPASRSFADAPELEVAIDTLPFPCIVKPAYNQDWFWETQELSARFGDYKSALRRFDRACDLHTFCASLPPRRSGFIVQAYIDGLDERLVSFHAYLDERSRCLGYFLTREIRTNPPRTGESTYCETIQDDALARSSQIYLERIDFRGVVKIDYKFDVQAQTYKMLEIEPHYQAAHLLGACSGVNLAQIAYRHARGDPFDAPGQCANRVRLLDLPQDLKAYWRGYRKTNEWSALQYFRSLFTGRKYFRLYNLRDPLPFLDCALRYLLFKLRLSFASSRSAGGTRALSLNDQHSPAR